MHAAVVSSVGLVVDATVLERSLDVVDFNPPGFALTEESAQCLSAMLAMSADADTHTQTRRHSSCHSSSSGAPPVLERYPSFALPFSSTVCDEVRYECRALGRPLPQSTFHRLDVLPFGFESPSEVFAVVGRHTNRGLVLGVSDDGLFIVRPYAAGALQLMRRGGDRTRLHPEAVAEIAHASKTPLVAEGMALFLDHSARIMSERNRANAAAEAANGTAAACHEVETSEFPMSADVSERRETANGSSLSNAKENNKSNPIMHYINPINDNVEANAEADNTNNLMRLLQGTEQWLLKDLQLPPSLALHGPIAPIRVGSRVVARRFGCDTSLQLARVCAVTYDITYNLQYESDGDMDAGVLHNDVHLLDDSEAELCAVRDRITVALHKQLPAVVLECLGGEAYRVVLESNPGQALDITRRHIVFVAPLLGEALYADPDFVNWFRALDSTSSGLVPWKEVRHLILSWESYGQSLSFQRLGEIQRDLCIRVGRVEPQLLRKVPVQEEEMLLRYPEFEYVIQRARNML